MRVPSKIWILLYKGLFRVSDGGRGGRDAPCR
jgi:hypothetical protein